MPVAPDPSTAFAEFAHPDRLVSTEWLSANLGAPGLKVVESDEDVLLYDVGHIPGAVKIDWHLDLNDPVTRDYIDGAKFAELMNRKGIGTPISLDHAEYLGTDLAGIAEEKAGIIKKGREDLVPVDTVAIIAEQTPEVMEVLLRRAVEVEAAVAREGSEFKVLARQIAVGGQQLELQGLSGVYTDIFLPLHGEHQAHNAALALAAVEAFFGAGPDRQLDQDAIRNGFASVVNPGRLERVRSAPTVFLDAAHTPDGARALAAALAAEFDFRKLVGVVSVMADKDVDAILTAFESVFDEIVVTHNGSPRAMDVEELANIAVAKFGDERVVVAPVLADALEVAIEIAEQVAEPGEAVSGAGVVVTGSVVTAGAARTLFGKDPA